MERELKALKAELDASKEQCAEYKARAEVSEERAKELADECESVRKKSAALERSE